MSNFTAEQLTQLASILKGTDVEAALLAQSGATSANPVDTKTSPPVTETTIQKKTTDTPSDKTGQQTETPADLSKIDGKPQPKPESASGILSLFARNYLQRPEFPGPHRFTPSAQMCFHILNEMDTLMAQNFYARRAIPCLFPTVSRIYIAIVFIMRTLACQYHMRSVDNKESDLVERFFELFPPSTLPIPAPLVPIFKSLNCSTPESSLYSKVFPYVYDRFGTANSYRVAALANELGHFLLPLVSSLLFVHKNLMTPHYTSATLGEPDSAGPGYRTVAKTRSTEHPFVVDLLKSYDPAVSQLSPFGWDYPPAVSNTVTNPDNHRYIKLFGYTDRADWTGLTANEHWAATKIGHLPIIVPDELIDQFKKNFRLLPTPVQTPTSTPATISEAIGFGTDYRWFGKFIQTMSKYSTFWPGSTTLGECSIEGPPVGQYFAVRAPPSTLPTEPAYWYDPASIDDLTVSLSTTRKSEEPVSETLVYATQIHLQQYPTHPHVPTIGHGHSTYNGEFWNQAPYYTEGTKDKGWTRIPEYLQSTVLERTK